MTKFIATECPDPARLRALINGSVSVNEQAQLTNHLDHCNSCQQVIENVATGGSSLLGFASNAKDVQPADGSAFWPALRKLEREVLRPTRTAITFSSGDVPYSETSLDFLDPVEEPGILGKLGNFHVIEIIGQGGMGLVLRTFDVCLQRQVAVKVLDPRYVKNELARNRFIREARAAASISHENVVAVYHVDKHREEIPFLVMRLVTGESLQEHLEAAKGPLDLHETLRIGRQVATGLAAAHAKAMIHRDIKPANILLEAGTGRVLLTDFGLARAMEDVKLTQTGFVAGTPLYMSPEQARGEPLDHRSDLFTLGVVLYAMCAGAPPFQGLSPLAVLREVTEAQHRKLREVNPRVPDDLAEIIDHLLAKKQDDRIQSAMEVVELLAAIEDKLSFDPMFASSPSRTSRPRAVARDMRWNKYGMRIAISALLLSGLLLISETAKLTQWTLIGQRGGSTASDQLPEKIDQVPLANGREPRPEAVFDAGAGPIWSIALSPEATVMVAALDDGTLRIWDVISGRVIRVLAHKGPVWCVTFNTDGSMFATASEDGLVKLWDPLTGKNIDRIDLHTPLHSIAFSADGKRFATGTKSGAVRVWETASRKSQAVMQDRHARAVTALAFSTDGTCLASSSEDHTVKIWDLSDDEGREINTFDDNNGPVHTVAFHPHRKLVAFGGWDQTIRLWDIDQGMPVDKLDKQGADIRSIAFTSDGSRIIFAAENGRAGIWDQATGTKPESLRWDGAITGGMALDAAGRIIAIAQRDGTVNLWKVPPLRFDNKSP